MPSLDRSTVEVCETTPLKSARIGSNGMSELSRSALDFHGVSYDYDLERMQAGNVVGMVRTPFNVASVVGRTMT